MPWCWGVVASGDFENCICPENNIESEPTHGKGTVSRGVVVEPGVSEPSNRVNAKPSLRLVSAAHNLAVPVPSVDKKAN